MPTTEVNVKTDDAPVKPVVKSSRLHKEERVPWQRLALSLLGITILAGIWRWAVWHLYALPEHSISAYASITNNTMYAVATIVVFFISGKMLFDWKNQTTSTIVDQASHIFEKREEKIEQVITMRTEGGAKAFADDIE